VRKRTLTYLHSKMWLLWIWPPACQLPSFPGSCQPPSRSRLPLYNWPVLPASGQSRARAGCEQLGKEKEKDQERLRSRTDMWLIFAANRLMMQGNSERYKFVTGHFFIVFVCQLGGLPCLSRTRHWTLCARLAEQDLRSGLIPPWSSS
jgi:hypothetical protein